MSVKQLLDLISSKENQFRGKKFDLPKEHDVESAGVKSGEIFLHQAECIESFFTAWPLNGIIHLPTGAGKTRVALEIIKRCNKENPKTKFIWATYPVSLIRQGMARLVEISPSLFRDSSLQSFIWADSKTLKSSLNQADIVFLMRDHLGILLEKSIKTNNSLRAFLSDTENRLVIIYDECHQMGAELLRERWTKFQESIPQNNVSIIGLSATPLPTTGEGKDFLRKVFPAMHQCKGVYPHLETLIYYSANNKDLVDREILCPINLSLQKTGIFDIPRQILVQVIGSSKIISSLPTKPTRDRLEEFARQFNRDVMSSKAVLDFLGKQIGDHLSTLGKTLVFVPTIEAANYLTSVFHNHPKVGLGRVSVVHSKIGEMGEIDENDNDQDPSNPYKQIKEFQDRRDKPCVMVNVGMLTTGFDDPKIKTVVLARLTLSKNLFWQMIGRGTRGPLVDGTTDVFVIDPIRLTDKFSVFDGYFKNIEAPTIYEIESNSDQGDNDGIPSGESHPVIDSLPLPGTDEKESICIDEDIRQDVISALIAFLGGYNGISGDDLLKIVKETQVRYDDKSERWQLSKVVDQKQLSDSNHLSFCNQLIKNAEKNLQADLFWLNNYLPRIFNEEDIDEFFTTVKFVEAHAISTSSDYKKKMKELKMNNLPEKKAEKEIHFNKSSSNQKPENIPQLVKIENELTIDKMVFSTDNSYLLGIEERGGKIKLWDAFNGKELRTFNHDGSCWIYSASFSMDNRYLLSVGSGNVKIWMVNDGCEYQTFEGGYEEAILSPDNCNLLMGHRNLFTLYQVDNKKKLKIFPVTEPKTSNKRRIDAIAFSPAGCYALAGQNYGTLRLWEIDSGKELGVLRPTHYRSVGTVVFSFDGNYALSSHGSSQGPDLILWDIKNLQELQIFRGHSDRIRTTAFSKDGNYVLSGSDDKTLKLWALKNGQELKTFTDHSDQVLAVAFSQDGRYVISAGRDNTIRRWLIE